ncbi:Phage repressor protein C, contains Cro/C1-type HTH and peptisase s24 domains [Roseivivax halotolerans]|uniref:Phage repressor protein C, contains Cro/C1-type HTH and peptisase s24 domains n=1 Tax=Roseivivax halotolerans TaxID=93684 RepID=A0A1I5W1F0_9RHOB|nr:Phage repressor protein C, contains Cro/C1-type HTH and peptisase s24 domains [Roseivivax halotolerans]
MGTDYAFLHLSVNVKLHQKSKRSCAECMGCAWRVVRCKFALMIPDRIQLFELFEARRKELGLSQAEVGRRAFGKEDNSALQGIRRGSSPSWDKVRALCEALRLELYVGEARDFSNSNHNTSFPDEEFAHIPVHAATLAAGVGRLNSDEITDYLAFKRTWLRRIGVAPKDAVLARIELGEAGESMSPTIQPGDMVLIDTSRVTIPIRTASNKFKPPIYAIRTEMGARVKRVSKVDEGIIALVSDNPNISVELLSSESFGELEILGKVVWWGHTAET